MKNNDIKNLLNSNSILDIDKRILPLFSVPVLLKRISDAKKDKNYSPLNPPKKLMYKFIKLNEKLVKLTTSIKKYDLNLDSFYLNKKNLSLPSSMLLAISQPKIGKGKTDLAALAHKHYFPYGAGEARAKEDFPALRSSSHNLDMNVGNKSEFILFTRNNSDYNLKFSLSNILYIIEKLRPILKFNSLLKNIYLFVPKRLLKPHPYIGFNYRLIQINNNFKKNYLVSGQARLALPLAQNPEPGAESVGEAVNLITNYNYILPVSPAVVLEGNSKKKSGHYNLPYKLVTGAKQQQLKPRVVGQGKANLTNLKKEGQLLPFPFREEARAIGRPGLGYAAEQQHKLREKSSKVLIKINNYNEQSSLSLTNDNNLSIIQLHKFENARSIKYILLELNNLLNEIENLIDIKNTFIASIRKKKIEDLVNFIKLSIIIKKNESENAKKGHLPSSNYSTLIA